MDFLGMTPVSNEEKDQVLGGAPAPIPANPANPDKPAEGSEPPKQTEGAPASEPTFTIDVFNKTFGTAFEQEDGLKDVLSKGLKYSEVEKEKEELAKKNAELLAVANKSLNPREFFSSDDAYLREQLLLKHKDNSEVVKYLTDLTPTKVKSMTDLEALKYGLLIDNPALDGGEAGALELLQEKYGYIDDPDSLSRVQKNQLMLDAKAARQKLDSLYEGINLPDTKSWEDTTQRTKEVWSKPAKDLIDGITELSLGDDLKFVVDAASKEGIYEQVLARVVNSKIDINEDAMRQIAGEVRSTILERNLDKVIAHIKNVASEQTKEQLRKELHNDTPLNNGSGESGDVDLNSQTLSKL